MTSMSVGTLIHVDRILHRFRCLASICLKADNVLTFKVHITVLHIHIIVKTHTHTPFVDRGMRTDGMGAKVRGSKSLQSYLKSTEIDWYTLVPADTCKHKYTPVHGDELCSLTAVALVQ